MFSSGFKPEMQGWTDITHYIISLYFSMMLWILPAIGFLIMLGTFWDAKHGRDQITAGEESSKRTKAISKHDKHKRCFVFFYCRLTAFTICFFCDWWFYRCWLPQPWARWQLIKVSDKCVAMNSTSWWGGRWEKQWKSQKRCIVDVSTAVELQSGWQQKSPIEIARLPGVRIEAREIQVQILIYCVNPSGFCC